jgi:1,2-diacylglycerol 3-alpha-glucosyltransferase
VKIAFFTDTFYPQVNGVVTALDSLSLELKRQGHDVEIFAPAPGPADFEGIPVHRFRSVAFRPYPEFRAALPPLLVNKFIARRGFDVVHTHGPFTMGWTGLYAARRNRLPCVSTFHTPFSEYVHYLFGNRARLVMLGKRVAWDYSKRHYNRYDHVIVPSNVVRTLVISKGVRKPVSVIPNGVDIKRIARVPHEDAARRFGVRGRYVIHAGRLSREKNVSDALRAMKKIKGVKLVVTSRGPAELELRKTAKSLGVSNRVVFTGFVDFEDLVNLYRGAELAVIPSEAETQGMVILEAMACGTPVVGADYLAIPETVMNDENGRLFELHDTASLAESVNSLLSDKRELARLGRNARKTAELNSVERRTKQLVNLYESL